MDHIYQQRKVAQYLILYIRLGNLLNGDVADGAKME